MKINFLSPQIIDPGHKNTQKTLYMKIQYWGSVVLFQEVKSIEIV